MWPRKFDTLRVKKQEISGWEEEWTKSLPQTGRGGRKHPLRRGSTNDTYRPYREVSDVARYSYLATKEVSVVAVGPTREA